MIYDVVIIGAGIIGMLNAIAAGLSGKTVLLLDKACQPPEWQSSIHPCGRIHAYNLKSIEFMEELGIWHNIDELAKHNFTGLKVVAGNSELSIGADNNMGTFVSSVAMLSALMRKIADLEHVKIQWQSEIMAIRQSSDLVSIILKDKRIQAEIAIACDGGNSWVRKNLGIPCKTHNFNQSCFVGFLEFDGCHNNVAWQDFTGSGTLGLLPYGANMYSLAWSLDNVIANDIDNSNILDKLNNMRFPAEISSLISLKNLQKFPLYALHAKNYFSNRVVLAGDACHAIHPLAGLGLNLGVADVKTLSACLYNDISVDIAFASYEHKQIQINKMVMDGLTAMQQLFKNQAICSAAISIANNPMIKNALEALANQRNIYTMV